MVNYFREHEYHLLVPGSAIRESHSNGTQTNRYQVRDLYPDGRDDPTVRAPPGRSGAPDFTAPRSRERAADCLLRRDRRRERTAQLPPTSQRGARQANAGRYWATAPDGPVRANLRAVRYHRG